MKLNLDPMIKLKIDNQTIEVEKGATVLDAARKVGKEIPSMCYKEGYSNHPSCMVCVVKNFQTGDLIPSCAYPAQDGMEISTDDNDVREARKEALELLLSDHIGDCEAPCTLACPAGMDIPLMNRLIAENKLDEAIRIVKRHIALPLVLGYVCPAPCEKACRRKQVDESISICQLKRFVAGQDVAGEANFLPEKPAESGKKVAIIGAGPAGLAAAYHLAEMGHTCEVYDKREVAGGSLSDLSPDELPEKTIEKDIAAIKKLGVVFHLKQAVDKQKFDSLSQSYDALLLATGEASDELASFGLEMEPEKGLQINKNYQTNLEGIFACGSVIKKQKMAVRALAQGRDAALSVDAWLQKQNRAPEIQFNSKFGKLQPLEIIEYKKEASGSNVKRPDVDFMQSFSEKQAQVEANLCMHCDCRKPQSCKLRIYADEYKADRRKYLMGDRNLIRKMNHHDLVIYEPEKCIRCGLCIEIAQKREDLSGLTFIGRGFDVRVQVPFNETLQQALEDTAIECAEACPTGAIAMKDKEERLR